MGKTHTHTHTHTHVKLSHAHTIETAPLEVITCSHINTVGALLKIITISHNNILPT